MAGNNSWITAAENGSADASAALDGTEDFDLYKFYRILNGLVGSTICILGLVGNAVSIPVLIYMYRQSRTSTNAFLVSLAVSDFLVLTNYLIYDLTCVAAPPSPIIGLRDLANHSDFFTNLVFFTWYFPANVFMTFSNWCIVSVMLFRFIVVYFPLKASQKCSVHRAKRVLLAIAVSSVLLVLPEFFLVKVVRTEGGLAFNDSKLFGSPEFNAIYYPIMESLNSFIPFILCSVFSLLLIKTLRTKDRQRSTKTPAGGGRGKRGGGASRRSQKISAMLLVITVWFLICTAPSFACRLYKYHLVAGSSPDRTSFTVFRSVADLLLLLNHTMNFVLYAATSANYRRCLKDVLMCRSRRSVEREASVARSLIARNVTGTNRRFIDSCKPVHGTDRSRTNIPLLAS